MMVDGINFLFVVKSQENDGDDQGYIYGKGFAAIFYLRETACCDKKEE